MLSQLNATLAAIKKLNESKFVKKKLAEKEIEEQSKNLRDLEKLLTKYSETINELKNKKEIDINTIEYFFAHVHATLIDLIWHIDQIDELLIDLIKGVPKIEGK